MNPEIFIELSKILMVTVLVSAVVKLLKQPAIIGYIFSGIIAGPYVLDIINSVETFNAFSQIGVALLLFFVGLNLNPKVIKDVGKISFITGIGQVLFTSLIGFGILLALGFDMLSAVYMSVAIAFSSTIVIMKLLSDKNAYDTLYGRISIGFLIVQDFIAIFILLAISSISQGENLLAMAVQSLIKATGGILILFLLTIYVLPKLTKKIAKSQEFLLLFSLAWCFIVATGFHFLNLSIEAGALLAGIALSMSPYNFEISSRLKPLRDFFLVIFFVMLGSEMVFGNIVQNIWTILGISAFILIGNPIVVMALMGFFGYTKRNGFMAGLNVAQISEFSLIVVSMGVSVGHVPAEVLSILTAVALITFAGSTYMILYSDKIYPFLSKYLSIFERKGKKVDEHKYHSETSHDIILIGSNRVGFDIVQSLKKIKKKFLIVDYDPEVVSKLSKLGYECRYGDANDMELLEDLNFKDAKMIISTIPEVEANSTLIEHARSANPKAIVAVVSHHLDDAELLYEKGATYVIMPHFLGGKYFSTLIEKNQLSVESFLEERISHMEHLRKRKKLDQHIFGAPKPSDN